MSAQKMREVVRQIQGLPALQAQAVLAVVPRKGARVVAKTLEIRHRQRGKQQASSSRKRCASRKRSPARRRASSGFTPKARGSAGPILKRRCHIKITLSDE